MADTREESVEADPDFIAKLTAYHAERGYVLHLQNNAYPCTEQDYQSSCGARSKGENRDVFCSR